MKSIFRCGNSCRICWWRRSIRATFSTGFEPGENAAEALPAGGTLRSAACVRARGTNARLTVADNGRGIPPGIQTRLFEAFQSDKADAGNGLGLMDLQNNRRETRGTNSLAQLYMSPPTENVLCVAPFGLRRKNFWERGPHRTRPDDPLSYQIGFSLPA